ncbi:MAG: hypothetical protein P4M08_09405 [Oligoflexia bacterium]|nr:hypothetical protein [Oligoflexia bacterium]
MDQKTRRFIQKIYQNQIKMTLATIRLDNYPQATLLAYAYELLARRFKTMVPKESSMKRVA